MSQPDPALVQAARAWFGKNGEQFSTDQMRLIAAFGAAQRAEERGIAWLIEDITTPTTHYWAGEPGWTNDPNTAVRFARKWDAEQVLRFVENRQGLYRVAEHLWLAALRAARTEGT